MVEAKGIQALVEVMSGLDHTRMLVGPKDMVVPGGASDAHS